MLKLIDRIYFNLRNITRDPNEMYNEGFAAGLETGKARTLSELSERSLAGFPSDALALGYAHAVEVVKGNLK